MVIHARNWRHNNRRLRCLPGRVARIMTEQVVRWKSAFRSLRAVEAFRKKCANNACSAMYIFDWDEYRAIQNYLILSRRHGKYCIPGFHFGISCENSEICTTSLYLSGIENWLFGRRCPLDLYPWLPHRQWEIWHWKNTFNESWSSLNCLRFPLWGCLH
jgi:hypothetical protein